jgi:GT2 family glycosyltransferase
MEIYQKNQPIGMKKTSVIILNWNGRKLLEQFLPTVLKHSVSDNCEVIVADNGSVDDSVSFLETQYPMVPLIVFDKNHGFAEGYNKAIQEVDSEYVVLLNSDIETTEGWLDPLIRYLDTHPETAAVQPKLRAFFDRKKFEYAGAAGGFIDRYAYPFCRGRILENVETDYGQYDTIVPVFWATGACLCIRRSDYLDVGGLDADFFAHMEEIDLCWRLNARGQKIECIPASVVYHMGGASLNKENPQKTYLNFRNNLLMIYKNIPTSRLIEVVIARFFFDFLAFVHLCLEGKFQNASAVTTAYVDFFKMRRRYKDIRKENLEKTIVTTIPTQFKGSILWNYYFKRKKTYQQLFKTH